MAEYAKAMRNALYTAITAQDVGRFEQILNEIKSGDANISVILNYRDQRGDTVLHDIASEGEEKSIEFFRLCFQNGADPLERNNVKQTPFEHYFQTNGMLDKEVVEFLLNAIPTYEFFGSIEELGEYPAYNDLQKLRVRTDAEYGYITGACEKMEALGVGGSETVKELFEEKTSKKFGQFRREEDVLTAIRSFCKALKEDKPGEANTFIAVKIFDDTLGSLEKKLAEHVSDNHREIEYFKKFSDDVWSLKKRCDEEVRDDHMIVKTFDEGVKELEKKYAEALQKQGDGRIGEYVEVLRKLLVNTDYDMEERPLDFVNRKIKAEDDAEINGDWRELRGTMVGLGALTATQIAERLKEALPMNGIRPPQGGVNAGARDTGKTGGKLLS